MCNQPGHFAASCSLGSPYPNRFHPFPPNSQLPQEISGGQSTAVQPPSGPTANFRPQMQIQFCGQYNKYGRCAAGCHPATHKCIIGQSAEDLTQGESALHSLSLTNFQDTNTSSQVFKILPHVSDKFNQLIVPLPPPPPPPPNQQLQLM